MVVLVVVVMVVVVVVVAPAPMPVLREFSGGCGGRLLWCQCWGSLVVVLLLTDHAPGELQLTQAR